MTAPPNVSDLPDRLAEQLTDAGQAHLIRVAGMLGADQRGRFVAELASIDWRTVGELRDRVLEAAPRPDSSREVSPPEVFRNTTSGMSPSTRGRIALAEPCWNRSTSAPDAPRPARATPWLR